MTDTVSETNTTKPEQIVVELHDPYSCKLRLARIVPTHENFRYFLREERFGAHMSQRLAEIDLPGQRSTALKVGGLAAVSAAAFSGLAYVSHRQAQASIAESGDTSATSLPIMADATGTLAVLAAGATFLCLKSVWNRHRDIPKAMAKAQEYRETAEKLRTTRNEYFAMEHGAVDATPAVG